MDKEYIKKELKKMTGKEIFSDYELFTKKKLSLDWNIIKTDKDLIKEVVKKQYYLIALFKDYIDDYDVALLSIKNSGLGYQHISDRLKNNRDLALLAVKRYGGVFIELKEQFKSDKEIIEEAIRKYPMNIGNVDKSLYNNKEFVLSHKDIIYKYKKYLNVLYDILLKYEREKELLSKLLIKDNVENKLRKKI